LTTYSVRNTLRRSGGSAMPHRVKVIVSLPVEAAGGDAARGARVRV
jgi:hypothetical protein